MIKIIYNGVDISDDVSIKRCYHDMYSAGRSDTVDLHFFDSGSLWDKWSPCSGDEIRIDYGSISSGTMFLTSATPKNGVFEIVAQSAPHSGFVRKSKAWQRVRLFQIVAEIAERNGLAYAIYGIEDQLYSYISQENESDYVFLNQLLAQEGCAFLVYDKKLIAYSEIYFESQKHKESLVVASDADYRYHDRRSELYGECIVTKGQHIGRYAIDSNSERILRPQKVLAVGSDGEAERFAKGLLRASNKGCLTGFVRSKILTGYAPASMVSLLNYRATSWDGAAFIDHIRNDYGRGLSKIFFRKPLEGY